MKKSILLILVWILISCSTSPESFSTQTAGVWTPTPEATFTIKPTPTLDPNEDPDGDSYLTYQEESWGTDPEKTTFFDEIRNQKNEKGGIFAKLTVSQPFSLIRNKDDQLDLDKLNSTVFQVVNLDYSIDEFGTPDNSSDDHLTIEVVLFPYAKQRIVELEVEEFPIKNQEYSSWIQVSSATVII